MGNPNRDAIFLYSENSRTKLKDLAISLKKSSQLLKYTTNQLLKERYLINPHTIIDYSQLGLLLFRVYFKGAYISDRDKNAILHELSNNPYATASYELEGEFDLVSEFIASNPSRFNKEMKKLSSLIPTLNNYQVILNVVTHIYPRFYLPRNPVLVELLTNEIIIGGDRPVATITADEKNIIHQLNLDPQIRLSTLARRTNLNIKTATKLLKSLERSKIIRGYKYNVNLRLLGGFQCRLFLNLHNVSQERESDMLHYFLRCKEIVQANKTLGNWDLEVDIESLDKSRIRFLTLEIREKFKDIIQSFNIMPLYEYYSKKHLPSYLFAPSSEHNDKGTVQARMTT